MAISINRRIKLTNALTTKIIAGKFSLRSRVHTDSATKKYQGSRGKVIADPINCLVVNGSNRAGTDSAFHDGLAENTEMHKKLQITIYRG